jgi:hypothetical protein
VNVNDMTKEEEDRHDLARVLAFVEDSLRLFDACHVWPCRTSNDMVFVRGAARRLAQKLGPPGPGQPKGPKIDDS